VSAYAEVEYVLTHLETSLDARNRAEDAVRSFNREFPALANSGPDLTKASAQDLRTYLTLLSAASVAFDSYVYWLRTLSGAEQAVIDGNTSLDDIYASERKLMGTGVRDPMRNFAIYRAARASPIAAHGTPTRVSSARSTQAL
jgi:hypothetical protein